MCPKSEGLEVRLLISTATDRWEAVKHFCQPSSPEEAKCILDQVVLGFGAAVLRIVPEGVAFRVGISAGKMTLLPPGPGEPEPFVLPELLAPYADAFRFVRRPVQKRERGSR